MGGTCYKCEPGFLLVRGECIDSCSDSFFFDPFSEACLPCKMGCSSCLSADVCTKCLQDYILEDNQCKLVCPEGSFLEEIKNSHTCRNCPKNCGKCSDHLTCHTCNLGFYKTNNHLCASCPPDCLECYDSLKCLLCKRWFKQVDFTCLMEEDVSSIWNTKFNLKTRLIKIKRDTTPETNLGNLRDQRTCLLEFSNRKCELCRPGYFLENNRCLACSSGCLQCDLYDFCLQCKSEYNSIVENGRVFCKSKVLFF